MGNEEIRNDELKEIKTEHLAMEILRQEQGKSKAKDAGVISLTVAVIVIAIGMAVINYRNDCEWRDLFASYDYITQDGDGINSANYGEQGDLNNGATSTEFEK